MLLRSRLRNVLGALLLVPLLGASCAAPRVGRPNIVLVIVDTLRADHMGCYGYPRDTSPGLDSLAAAGAMWSRTKAQSSWTLPAVTTMLSGLTPRGHGARLDVQDRTLWMPSSEMPTAAAVLGGDGYSTMGLFNVMLLSESMGFHRGFDRYACNDQGHGMAGETVDTAIDWLRTRPGGGEPFLLVMHLFDPHSPYDPPPPYDTLFAGSDDGPVSWTFTPEGAVADTTLRDRMVDLYDGEIAWTDSQLSRLWAELRRQGIQDATLVIVTADHGEEFLEHGYVEHGRTMFQEITRVPVILSGPGVHEGYEPDWIASQLDILPTMLAAAGTEPPPDLAGRDLLSGPPANERALPASGVNTGPPFQMASMRVGHRKVVWVPATDSTVMYRLDRDPEELEPLDPDSALQARLESYWLTPRRYEPVMSDIDVAPALRDLGYI